MCLLQGGIEAERRERERLIQQEQKDMQDSILALIRNRWTALVPCKIFFITADSFFLGTKDWQKRVSIIWRSTRLRSKGIFLGPQGPLVLPSVGPVCLLLSLSFGGTGHLQIIIQRIRPLANDHPDDHLEGVASYK